MIDTHYTYETMETEQLIRRVLRDFYRIEPAEFRTSLHGKPYIPGDPVYFNATHSKDLLAVVVGKTPLGLDCERTDGKPRPAVLARFTERERNEIQSTEDFYRHWTAREAYIKYLGSTLAADWRKVEFYGGEIYRNGVVQAATLRQFSVQNYAFSVCGNFSKYSLKKI